MHLHRTIPESHVLSFIGLFKRISLPLCFGMSMMIGLAVWSGMKMELKPKRTLKVAPSPFIYRWLSKKKN